MTTTSSASTTHYENQMRKDTIHNNNRSKNRNSSKTWSSLSIYMLALIAIGISFALGTLWGLHEQMKQCLDETGVLPVVAHKDPPSTISSRNMDDDPYFSLPQQPFITMASIISKYYAKQQQNHTTQLQQSPYHHKKKLYQNQEIKIFPDSTSAYAVGMARMEKMKFMDFFHVGVPVEPISHEEERDVLLLYNSYEAMPNTTTTTTTTTTIATTKLFNSTTATTYNNHRDHNDISFSHRPITFMEDVGKAVENCDFVNIMLSYHDKQQHRCLAIVPESESFHLYRYGRYASEKDKVNRSLPFRLIGYGQRDGKDEFSAPRERHIKRNWNFLRTFFEEVDHALEELHPILNKTARNNTVVVMVCNFGHSELLINFVCSARSRGLDTSHIILFATDIETKELAKAMGLSVYYNEKFFAEMPRMEAKAFGDKSFLSMMMVKVVAVQLVNILGFDLLFQDVDIVWYRDPMDYFHKELSIFNDFDMFFQDDGGRPVRFAPYGANSGFYYVKYNLRTQIFLTDVLLSGDLLYKRSSHQPFLIAKMIEHMSNFGLQIKVFHRDDTKFPGGFHFHRRSEEYFKPYLIVENHTISTTPHNNNTTTTSTTSHHHFHPYIILHMSWTKNKDDKILYLRQLGDWFVHDDCIQHPVEEILLLSITAAMNQSGTYHGNNSPRMPGASLQPFCCSKEALVSCHYRDKPSVIPCRDSPPAVKNKPSWWK